MANTVYDVKFTVSFKLKDNSTSDALSTDYRLTFVIPKTFSSSSQVKVSKIDKNFVKGLSYLKYMTINNNGEVFVYFSEKVTPV